MSDLPDDNSGRDYPNRGGTRPLRPMAGPDGNYGPGFRRMVRRAGPGGMEALRQDTLAAQARAREDAAETRPVEGRDRDWYRDYPVPRGKRRGKK